MISNTKPQKRHSLFRFAKRIASSTATSSVASCALPQKSPEKLRLHFCNELKTFVTTPAQWLWIVMIEHSLPAAHLAFRAKQSHRHLKCLRVQITPINNSKPKIVQITCDWLHSKPVKMLFWSLWTAESLSVQTTGSTVSDCCRAPSSKEVIWNQATWFVY